MEGMPAVLGGLCAIQSGTAGKRSAVLLAFVLAVGLLLPGEAAARPEGRYHLGIGLAGSRVSGDLDGTQTYSIDPTNGPTVWAGEPGNGRGVHLAGGVDLNRHLGIEAHLINTRHETTHEQLPGESPLANIVSFFAAVRGMLPLGDSFEGFGRLGLGGVSIEYQDNAQLQPNPTRLNSNLSGGGLMGGLGVATFFDPIGVELGVLWQSATLRNLSSADQQVEVSDLKLALTTVTLTVTVHFGGPPPNPESAFPPDERPPSPPATDAPATPGAPAIQ